MNTPIDNEKMATEKTAGCKASVVERLVMWLDEWRRVRNARRLYKRLWKANHIILFENSSYKKRENKQFKKELSKCSDALERCIVIISNSYDT